MRHHRILSICQPSIDQDINLQLIHELQTTLKRMQCHETVAAESQQMWTYLYPICDSLLRRYATNCRVSSGDLDDCVQSAWSSIVMALPTFQDHGQLDRFYAWLQRVVHSKAIDLRRYRVRHPTIPLTSIDESRMTSAEADTAGDDEKCILQARLQQIADGMRRSMSATNKRIFELYCLEERSAKQIAAELNLSEGQVRYRGWRMKRKFRLLFDSDGRST